MTAAVVAFLCVFCAVFAGFVAPHNPFDLTTLELATQDYRLLGMTQAAQNSYLERMIKGEISCPL